MVRMEVRQRVSARGSRKTSLTGGADKGGGVNREGSSYENVVPKEKWLCLKSLENS